MKHFSCLGHVLETHQERDTTNKQKTARSSFGRFQFDPQQLNVSSPGTRWILQMGNWTKANNSPKIKQPSDCRRNATLLEESPPNAKLDARLHIVYRRTMTTVQAADTSVVVQIHVRRAIVCNARQKKWTQRFSFRRSHGVHVGLEALRTQPQPQVPPACDSRKKKKCHG